MGFYSCDNAVPLEMHKVRIVQKLTLRPLEGRLAAIDGAGHNTFLLQNADVFLGALRGVGTGGCAAGGGDGWVRCGGGRVGGWV